MPESRRINRIISTTEPNGSHQSPPVSDAPENLSMNDPRRHTVTDRIQTGYYEKEDVLRDIADQIRSLLHRE